MKVFEGKGIEWELEIFPSKQNVGCKQKLILELKMSYLNITGRYQSNLKPASIERYTGHRNPNLLFHSESSTPRQKNTLDHLLLLPTGEAS